MNNTILLLSASAAVLALASCGATSRVTDAAQAAGSGALDTATAAGGGALTTVTETGGSVAQGVASGDIKQATVGTAQAAGGGALDTVKDTGGEAVDTGVEVIDAVRGSAE